MGFVDRPDLPFMNDGWAKEALANTLYLLTCMDFGLDIGTGEITATYDDPDEGQKPLMGSPGEVMTDEKFYIPQAQTVEKRINLAFMLGYLVAKNQEQQENG